MQDRQQIAVMLLLSAGLFMGAASTASAPAAGDEVKAAMMRFEKALAANQVQEALAQTYVPNEETRSKTELYLECELRDNLFHAGMAEAFKGRIRGPATTMSEEQNKELESAKVTLQGDKALVKSDHDTFTLVRDKGVWKVDLLKTFERSLRHASKAEWDAAATGVKIRKQVIAEAISGKFKSPTEAYDEMRKRWTAAGVDDRPPGHGWEATVGLMDMVKMHLDGFKEMIGRYPTTAEGLAALVERPNSPGMEKYGHIFTNVLPTDAWNRAFIYTAPGKQGRAYDLSSTGFDGKPGTEDDILWNAGADEP